MTDPDPIEGAGPTIQSRAARRRHALRPVAGRATALVSVTAVVLGVTLVSVAVPRPGTPRVSPVGDGLTVAPTDAQDSSLFCTSGAGTDAGSGATGMVVLTNTTRTLADGSVTTVGTSGATVHTKVAVPALGSAIVTPSLALPGRIGGTATTYSFARGGITGTQVVLGPSGWSTAPCAGQVSPQWDFAGGSTTSGLMDLSLYDPTATAAVVGVTFLTASGAVLEPQAYQGIPLAPGQLVVEDLGAYVQEQPVVATLVECAFGSVVASELDQLAVAPGSGLALLSGVPGPSTTWHFAQMTAVPGGSVTVDIANPGTSAATVDASVGLSSASAEPQHLSVPARTVVTLHASEVAGWPLGAPYALTLTASSPVVVGRTVVAPTGSGSPQAGVGTGTISVAPSWLVVAPGAPGGPPIAGAAIHSLAVSDPGRHAVMVTVRRLDGGTKVAAARISAGGVVVFGPGRVVGLQPMVVDASGPVVVEADSIPSGAPGIIASTGFPLGT